MVGRLIFIGLCLWAAVLPLTGQSEGSVETESPVVWPTDFEGRDLVELTLTDKEIRFTRNFPGAIGRFTTGDNEILMRWIRRPNRKVHPSADCFKGHGYEVSPMSPYIDEQGRLWGRLSAERAELTLHVREQIVDPQGNSWSDVSSWYWAAVLGETEGPWLAMTVATIQK